MKRAIMRFVASLEDGEKYKIFIAVIISLCIVAVCIGIYVDKYYKYAEIDPLMIMLPSKGARYADEIATLKASFNNIFTNDVKTSNDSGVKVSYEKSNETNDELVYNAYDLNHPSDYFNVDADIPQINIKSPTIDRINQEITEKYRQKAYAYMRKTEGMTIYNVKYAAYTNNAYLSLVIRESLKEDGKPEKVTIKTYNYNISTDKEVSIDDLIQLKKFTKEDVQSTIVKDIQTIDANAKVLAKEYGSVYSRDLNSDMYKVENTENYFLTNEGYVYIVYAYGNTEDTNEMDIVIF